MVHTPLPSTPLVMILEIFVQGPLDSPRTGARFSENRSTVFREPDTPKLENWRTPQWRTGEHLHVLHVLRTYSTCSQFPSRMVGWNDLCTPVPEQVNHQCRCCFANCHQISLFLSHWCVCVAVILVARPASGTCGGWGGKADSGTCDLEHSDPPSQPSNPSNSPLKPI